MSFTITFGSIGDLIAVCQLTASVAPALSESRGSCKEYQCLIKQLQIFEQTLFQVSILWQTYYSHPEFVELCKIAESAIEDCQEELERFRERIEKRYGKYLIREGVRLRMKDAGKTVLWMKEKTAIAELRWKLETGGNAITMLTIAAMGRSGSLASEKQTQNSHSIQGLNQLSFRKTEALRMQLCSTDDNLDSLAEVTQEVLHSTKESITNIIAVRKDVCEMKIVLDVLKNFMDTQHTAPTGLGGTWKQDLITFEDALGKVVPIPLERIDCWEMLETLLGNRFRTQQYPGQKKLLRGEYVIEDALTGKEIGRKSCWNSAFQPGKKIVMGIAFILQPLDPGKYRPSYPGCNTPHNYDSQRDEAQCSNPQCEIRFRVGRRDVPHFVRTIDHGKEDDDNVEDSPSKFRRVSILLASRDCCFTVSEIFSVCRCLFKKHSDIFHMCAKFGTYGHDIEERTVLVGYACATHSNSRYIRERYVVWQ